MRPKTSGMNDSFWDAFMIKMLGLFKQDVVFDKDRPPRSSFKGVLIVRNDNSRLRCHRGVSSTSDLV